MTRPNESALERLGEGADLPPGRRRTLVDRIAPAAEGPPQGRRRLAAWWVVAAAAAIAVAAGVTLWAARPEPIPPTALVGDLLGPLPNLPASEPAPAEPQDGALPISDALAVVWEDLEDPLAIVSQAVEAPRALLGDPPAGPAPADEPDVTKEN